MRHEKRPDRKPEPSPTDNNPVKPPEPKQPVIVQTASEPARSILKKKSAYDPVSTSKPSPAAVIVRPDEVEDDAEQLKAVNVAQG